jgi:hypothetical protein
MYNLNKCLETNMFKTTTKSSLNILKRLIVSFTHVVITFVQMNVCVGSDFINVKGVNKKDNYL